MFLRCVQKDMNNTWQQTNLIYFTIPCRTTTTFQKLSSWQVDFLHSNRWIRNAWMPHLQNLKRAFFSNDLWSSKTKDLQNKYFSIQFYFKMANNYLINLVKCCIHATFLNKIMGNKIRHLFFQYITGYHLVIVIVFIWATALIIKI